MGPIILLVFGIYRCGQSQQPRTQYPPQRNQPAPQVQVTPRYIPVQPVPYRDPARESVERMLMQPSPRLFEPSPNPNTIQLNPPRQQMNCRQQWVGNQWVTQCY